MRRTKSRVRLCICLLCLTLIFIWGNSLMPGEVSKQFSSWVSALLGSVLNSSAVMSESGHGLLRKIAHFSEFACFGLLLCWYLGMAGKKGKNLAVLTVLGGLAVACIDETIQLFTVDRGPGVRDVLIDTCGAAAGMFFLLCGHHWIKSRSGKNNLEDTI